VWNGGRVFSRSLSGLLYVTLLLLAFPAWAQDDGARAYMMVPKGTTTVSVRGHLLRSNLAIDPGTVVEDADLNTNLLVFQFVQALTVLDGQSFVFLVVPTSRIEAKATLPGDNVSKSISGFGDAQLGFVLGVYGTPSLSPADYANYSPGLAVNLLAKAFFPTGKYSELRSINIGANRFALRLAVPIVYAIGERMSDPHLMTIELLPTVTFYSKNDDPFEAERTKQKPLFILEGHLTRGFNKSFWASLDLLWRRGGEVEVDGVDADNFQRALSLGATGAFALSRRASLKLSYGGVVSRNEHGPNGWMARAILGFVL
jgi:hypothetical protein